MHPQTLRIYERRGLLHPFRTPGGTRRYSAQDLEQLRAHPGTTADGVNLEGVRKILELRDEVERLRHQVSRLRRLLGEAEERLSAAGSGTLVRNLPDVRRDLER